MVNAETQDDLYAIIKSKYPKDIQTMITYGASEEGIQRFIADFKTSMQAKASLTEENFNEEAIKVFILLYLSGKHVNVFDAIFNGWNLSASKLLDTYSTSGTNAVLDLLPDSFEEIGKIVKEKLLATTIVEGHISIYLGDIGSGLNTLILSKLNQEEINATFSQLQFTLNNSLNNQSISFIGGEVFLPDENGNMASDNGEGKITGKFRLTDVRTTYDRLIISGAGYIAQTIPLHLEITDMNTINATTTPIEMYPGDLGQIIPDQGLVFIPDDKISNVDFTAWLMIYTNRFAGSVPYEDRLKADFTKDGQVNNVDFTLWLFCYKNWKERNVFNE
jgi:hypothetical protein